MSQSDTKRCTSRYRIQYLVHNGQKVEPLSNDSGYHVLLFCCNLLSTLEQLPILGSGAGNSNNGSRCRCGDGPGAGATNNGSRLPTHLGEGK